MKMCNRKISRQITFSFLCTAGVFFNFTFNISSILIDGLDGFCFGVTFFSAVATFVRTLAWLQIIPGGGGGGGGGGGALAMEGNGGGTGMLFGGNWYDVGWIGTERCRWISKSVFISWNSWWSVSNFLDQSAISFSKNLTRPCKFNVIVANRTLENGLDIDSVTNFKRKFIQFKRYPSVTQTLEGSAAM